MRKTSNKPIVQLSMEGEVINFFSSGLEASREDFSFQSISKCCHGKRKSHKGFKWQFIEEAGE